MNSIKVSGRRGPVGIAAVSVGDESGCKITKTSPPASLSGDGWVLVPEGSTSPGQRDVFSRMDRTWAGGKTSLGAAAENGDDKTVGILLAAGAEVNGQDKSGRTALWWAAKCGRVEVVKLLVAHNADTTIPNERGLTPLNWAQKKNYAEIAKILQDAGALAKQEPQSASDPLEMPE